MSDIIVSIHLFISCILTTFNKDYVMMTMMQVGGFCNQ